MFDETTPFLTQVWPVILMQHINAIGHKSYAIPHLSPILVEIPVPTQVPADRGRPSFPPLRAPADDGRLWAAKWLPLASMGGDVAKHAGVEMVICGYST
jgi:hypothetical protein